MSTESLDRPIAAGLQKRCIRVALVGNPNSGKTTLFNALTGMRQKIANYPGVTVERKTGRMNGANGTVFEIIDLPGIYSLLPKSIDEQIAVEILKGTSPLEAAPDLIILIADVTNLTRSLYLSTQVMDLGFPVVIALNMMDLASKMGLQVDTKGLARRLGVPVVPMIAKRATGLQELRAALDQFASNTFAIETNAISLEAIEVAKICEPLVQWFKSNGVHSDAGAFAEALRVISQPEAIERWRERYGNSIQELVQAARQNFSMQGIPWRQAEIWVRYAAIDRICALFVREDTARRTALTEKLDRILTHRVLGPLIMFIILSTIFQSIYTWAQLPMAWIQDLMSWLGTQVELALSPGPLQDLLVNGVIGGVGSVLVFLPQIVFLFFLLGLLEDTGYLARVAFILDRFMARIGLSGQSVIPLLSSFACAIPGIMATRTIQNQRDRLLTILVAPFMSCSARLPVYTLMIGAFIPNIWFGGIFYFPGIVLLAMYFLGIFAAVVAAAVLQKFVVKGKSTSFIMELPLYRMPILKTILIRVYESGALFISNAGKIILAVSIVLWFLASYPKLGSPVAGAAASAEAASKPIGAASMAMQQIRNSYAGKIGHFIEPAIAPLGFDWKIGIGLITSFAAREVMVSTLATIYNLEDADETSVDLRKAMRRDTYPETGAPVFTPLVAISLMVFFVLACQCMSTLAIVRRETNSWRWPMLMFFYMLTFAYVGSLVVYQTGTLLGF